MSHEITVKLPRPPKACNPNARVHWGAKYRAMVRTKQDAELLTRAAIRKAGIRVNGSKAQLDLTYCPPDRRARDTDNMIAASKGIIDGIASAVGIDDSEFRFLVSRGEPRKGGEVIVKITVTS